MRRFIAAILSVMGLALAVAAPASATTVKSSKLTLTAKITSFRATASSVVGTGTISGTLRSGSNVSRASAPARFSVVSSANSRRCNVLTLRLAPVDLELLGVQVTTSYISLDVYALPGRVLGSLFCGLAHAKVSFPKAAHDLNRHLDGMRFLTESASMPAQAAQTGAAAQSCQVLKLVLGPLHLDLLGLVVDLYGRTHADPVVVKITANPSQGLLGQLLCGLAGGTGVTNIASLQSLLSTLGLNLSTTQITNLVNQLGINLSSGLSQLDLNRILQSLGLGSSQPAG